MEKLTGCTPLKVKNIKDHENSESLQREKADPLLQNGNQTSAFSVRALGCKQTKEWYFQSAEAPILSM